ncbi:DUF4097 family beta strand repeat-containing protein [Actinoplanes sp. G11-F43]|uniref:DUF4097 family beta strand repeat-containing protein n=1 Tax=Actinoplanes sp. G11-F43 TaxID=3424130 RepID=UPI003D341B6C
MTRRVALILAAVSLGALAGCDGVAGARMTFEDVEKTKITEIALAGGSGDVSVTTESGATETQIRRIVRGITSPDTSYQVAGGVLTLNTDCGPDCHLSYEITAPPGVAVRGEMRSGDVMLSAVGTIDVKMTSGDVMIDRATGPVSLEMTSGDVMVENTSEPVKVRSTSGDLMVVGGGPVDVEARAGNVDVTDGKGPVTARLTSGDISLSLSAASSVTASTGSGEISLMVPPGDYRVSAVSGNGEAVVENVKNNPAATNVLELRSRSGDVAVIAG